MSVSFLPSKMALTITDTPSCCRPPSSDVSMLYTFLPTVVKSRLPVLSSFRRTLKMATTRKSIPSHSRLPSEGSIPGFTSSNNAYVNTNNEVVTREQLWPVSRRTRDTSPETIASTASSTASSEIAVTPVDRALALPIQETRTGVEWDTAVTALLLLSKACTRAQHPDTKPENTRALIIDANKWLLRSLPDQLAPHELEEIEEVLPAGLDDPDRIQRRQARDRPRSSRPDKRSWLRRLIALVILQGSLLVALVIPYVTTLLNNCYRFERRHHMTERFLTGSVDMTNVVGESGMELKDAVFRLGQGRLISAVVHTGGWVVESVIGGVSDGAGEGVAIVGEAMLSREG